MKNLFIPYELAVIAKEKGFNENCYARYKDSLDFQEGFYNVHASESHTIIFAPLYQQIVDWFYYPNNIVISFDYQTYLWIISKDRNFIAEFGSIDKAITEAFKLI